MAKITVCRSHRTAAIELAIKMGFTRISEKDVEALKDIVSRRWIGPHVGWVRVQFARP